MIMCVHIHTHTHSQEHLNRSTESHHRKPWPWRRQPGPQSWSARSPAWCCAPQREHPAPAIADRCWSDTPRTGQGRCAHHSLPAVSAPRGENSWQHHGGSALLCRKADSHICCCYSTTNNQDICSEILWEKDIDKYSINNDNNTCI